MKKHKQQNTKKLSLKSAKDEYSPDDNPPRFSLKYLTKDKNFGWESLEKDAKNKLADRIYRLSQHAWSDLRCMDRHALGYEIIDKNALKLSIPTQITDNHNIIAFRFDGLSAMIGYRSVWGTFYIIAFDTKFQAYDH